ncbi:MAG: Epimerase family protein [Chlamydiales bacterium]|nr:Epimerase family protein [Chlamydiales bacterium]MCH9620047.1 Epimerase family protein [Chlamydiales bacterium]MCH9623534.1 Epimerase family protein [Chlamydiales bacterium]
MKIIIAGGRGFIGSHLASFFKQHELVILTREPNHEHFWDPLRQQIAPQLMEGVDVVINLAGESIAGRWTQQKMDAIRQSRFLATEFLTKLMGKHTPKLYIGASGMGYYGTQRDEELTEESASGHGYLAEVCRVWEEIPKKLTHIRQINMRLGLVLGADGGALRRMVLAFRLGLGGVLGNGSQMVSWITVEDVCRAIAHLIKREEISGPVNFVAKEAVTNRELTKTLGMLLHRPAMLPLPKWALKLLFKGGANVFLADLNLKPAVLESSGFSFHDPKLLGALRRMLS